MKARWTLSRPDVQLYERVLALGEPVYVVAEIGVNHDGDPEKARRLIDAAREAGADAVKFQAFDPVELVDAEAQTARYQSASTGEVDQRRMLEGLALSPECLAELRDYCARTGIDFLASAFGADQVEMLVGLGVGALKLGSGELTDPFVLDAARRSGLPLIASTGMAGRTDIDWAVARLAGSPLVLLHCTSAYPAPDTELHLRVLPKLGERYGVPVGYSDHSLGDTAALAAVSLGAVLIEKHFTLDRNAAGPDHRASTEPDELARLIRRVRRVEVQLGDSDKVVRRVEDDARAVARKGLRTTRDLAAGHVLKPGDLTARRPLRGLDPRNVDAVYGLKLTRDLAAGRPLTKDAIDEPTEDLQW